MQNATILAVDDSAAVRSFVKTVLNRAGFQVYLASSGEEGVSKYFESHPDAVFLDLQLPDANGLDVLAVLRALNPDLRCAMMHGGSVTHSDDDLRAAGAVDVLRKPFTLEAIVAAAGRLTSVPVQS